jgi:uncharacterized protein YutE (UPF0331/DUF86 family)/predicted nucleotidyltransferase
MAELRCFSHVLPPTLLIMLLYLGVGDRAGCKALKKQTVNDSLTLEYVLPRLRRLFDGLEDVEIALLFGSLARDKTSGHDVDIALKLKREDLLETGHIIAQVAKTLHINEDRIDVTSLDDVNPAMLSNILRDGIVIKADRAALELLMKKAQHIPDAKTELRMWGKVDPKPDRAVIISRVEEIRKNTEFIKNEILVKKLEELDYKEILALERSMHRIIESMLDICRHLVSVYALGFVESYGEYAEKLAEANKMDKDLAEDIAKLAGLRNILVHRYTEIRKELLYNAARETTERIVNKFIEWVKKLELEGV